MSLHRHAEVKAAGAEAVGAKAAGVIEARQLLVQADQIDQIRQHRSAGQNMLADSVIPGLILLVDSVPSQRFGLHFFLNFPAAVCYSRMSKPIKLKVT